MHLSVRGCGLVTSPLSMRRIVISVTLALPASSTGSNPSASRRALIR